MTKELFGEVERSSEKNEKQENKKKGFGLGRLFGR
jgi:hypothetical protein